MPKADISNAAPSISALNEQLLDAASDGDLGLVKQLLNAGADPNHAGVRGSTPLILAAWKGHKSIIDVLLTMGAAADRVNEYGRTAADYAERYGHSEIALHLSQRTT
ncbi:hypothetical protein CCP2SC5_1760004 [Azospirillaceae bacterium]